MSQKQKQNFDFAQQCFSPSEQEIIELYQLRERLGSQDSFSRFSYKLWQLGKELLERRLKDAELADAANKFNHLNRERAAKHAISLKNKKGV